MGRPVLRHRTVEWRIVDIDSSAGARLGLRSRNTFQLPEFPQVDFLFSFGAGRRSSGSSTADPEDGEWTCSLSLRASGQGCLGLALQVSLTATVEQASERNVEPEEPAPARAISALGEVVA